MNGRIRPLLLLSLLAVAVLVLFPEIVFAQTKPLAPGCEKYIGLTNHIAGCIRMTLKNATDGWFSGIFLIFARAIFWLLILAVTIFGAMAAMGMLEKPGRDVLMLVIKMVFVIYFSLSGRDLYNMTMVMMDSTAQTVVSYIPMQGKLDNTDNGDFSMVKCMRGMQVKQGTPDVVYIYTTNRVYTSLGISGPWVAMDCIIDTVIGIRVANSDPASGAAEAYNSTFNDSDKGLSRGLLYLFFSSMQSSVMGLLLFVVGMMFIWGMLQMIIKSLFIYLAGYIGLAVMMMFAPLFIPLVMFQSTKNYFDRWVKLVISFALQPIIILVFIAFSIAAVDLAMFSGDYSVMYRLTGDASRQKGFSLNSYLTCARDPANPKVCAASGVTPPETWKSIIEDTKVTYAKVKADQVEGKVDVDKSPFDSVVGGLDESKCVEKYYKILATDTPAQQTEKNELRAKCDKSYALGIFKKNINWTKMAQARTPAVTVEGNNNPTEAQLGEQIAKEAFAAILFAAIVIFVMNKLLMVIPMVAYDLIGDFGQSPNLGSAVGGTPGGAKMKAALGDMVSGRRDPT